MLLFDAVVVARRFFGALDVEQQVVLPLQAPQLNGLSPLVFGFHELRFGNLLHATHPFPRPPGVGKQFCLNVVPVVGGGGGANKQLQGK